MHCAHIQPSLKAFLDRELWGIGRLRVSLHLARCRACRAEAQAVRMISDEVSRLRVPEHSEGTRESVLAAAQHSRPSSTPATRRRVRAWALAAGSGVLLIAAGLLLALRPTPAQAALARVIAAADAARTIHLVMWNQLPGGPREVSEGWYANDRFRTEESRDGALTKVIVFDGQHQYSYTPATNLLYISTPHEHSRWTRAGLAVSAGLKKLAGSEVTVEDQVTADGRPVKRFVATSESFGERIVALADPETDLPVAVELYSRIGPDWRLTGAMETVSYNLPIDAGRFSFIPPTKARVVDHDELAKEWQQRYDQGMRRVQVDGQEVVLRDFQVTTTRDVYVIWSGMGVIERHGSNEELPAGAGEIRWEATLTDSLGTEYLRDDEYYVRSDPSVGFVPVVPPTSLPTWYLLTVHVAGRNPFSFRVTSPALSPLNFPVHPIFRNSKGWLDFNEDQGIAADIARAQMRGSYWQDHGDLRRALEQFESATSLADREFNRWYLGFQTWQRMGGMYEKLGMRSQARYAYQRAIESDRTGSDRRNMPTKFREVEAALQRLK